MGIRGIVLFFLLAMGAQAAQPCQRVNAAGALSVQHRPTAKFPAVLADVVPDYDRSQDILFSINNQHVNLYFGRYFWDWDSTKYTVREDPKAIAAMTIVKVRVGPELVRKLEESVEREDYLAFKAGTCAQRSVYFLQRHGIRLAGYVPVTGLTLFENATTLGFVDATGKAFPQETIALSRNGEDAMEVTRNYLKHHHVVYFTLFMNGYGVSTPDLVSLMQAQGVEPVIFEAIPLMGIGNEKVHEQITPRQHQFFFSVAMKVEKKIVAGLTQLAGSTHNALDWGVQNGYPATQVRPMLVQVLSQAIAETAQEMKN